MTEGEHPLTTAFPRLESLSVVSDFRIFQLGVRTLIAVPVACSYIKYYHISVRQHDLIGNSSSQIHDEIYANSRWFQHS